MERPDRGFKLLWWSVIIGVPQFVPMAFIHTGTGHYGRLWSSGWAS
jgi:hypothetical protein